MPSLMTTGTDTGIGKTFISAALAKSWRASKRDVGVMKPLISGCEPGPDGKLVPRDTLILKAAAGVDDPLDLLSTQMFEPPVAPNVAVHLGSETIDLTKTFRAFRELQSRHEWMIVEALGGALAPMTDEVSCADWCAEAGIPALIIARTDLGTLNHTLMTIEVLRARGVRVVGVVLNRLHGGEIGIAEQTNPETLARLTDVPIWGPVAHTEGVGDEAPIDQVIEHLPILDFADQIAEEVTGD